MKISIEFSDINYSKLYEGEKSDLKEFKSNPQLVKQYIKTVTKLKAISRIEDLYNFHSLHYEKKSGNLGGISAVRINDKYRLLFSEIPSKDDPDRIEILLIQEISNHYS